jgi:hypothetical protein
MTVVLLIVVSAVAIAALPYALSGFLRALDGR